MKHKLVSVVLAAGHAGIVFNGLWFQKRETTAKNDSGAITLKVFSNLPDRKNGQGLVEQMIIDDYMKEKYECEKSKWKLWTRKRIRRSSRHTPWKACRTSSVSGDSRPSWTRCWMRECLLS